MNTKALCRDAKHRYQKTMSPCSHTRKGGGRNPACPETAKKEALKELTTHCTTPPLQLPRRRHRIRAGCSKRPLNKILPRRSNTPRLHASPSNNSMQPLGGPTLDPPSIHSFGGGLGIKIKTITTTTTTTTTTGITTSYQAS
jgi:hypothetical protein